MNDPAVEAAARDWAMYKDIPFDADSLHGKRLIETAREALKPIRELHKAEGGGTPTGEYAVMCYECQDYWPCATARLIYSSEELS